MFGLGKKEEKKNKEVTLEDVVPLHPNEYPAKNLKHKLDQDREHMGEAGRPAQHDPGMSGTV